MSCKNIHSKKTLTGLFLLGILAAVLKRRSDQLFLPSSDHPARDTPMDRNP